MQDKHLFEYAVVRVVPKVEREEFLNVGVVVFCNRQKFLKAMVTVDATRIKAFSTHIDIVELQENLQAFVRICEGGKNAGPIGLLSNAERFRWLTAMRSTIVQTARPHAGFCTNITNRLEKLFNELVLDY